jgi:hypothetical protein
MSTMYQDKPLQKDYQKMGSFQLDNNSTLSLKKINDSMSQKIKQNQKQKIPVANQNVSNISSGLNTDKRNFYKINYFNEDINNGVFQRDGSQSFLSIDLNRFKINPNTFNTKKYENIAKSNKNNNKMKINIEENFETFNPQKEKMVENLNINDINSKYNENVENSNSNIYSGNLKITNKNTQNKQKNDQCSLLKNFDPYNVSIFLGETKKNKKATINLVNNISPSTSNLQMILYNKKLEKQNNQEYLKDNSSINNSNNISHNNLDNSALLSNKNNAPFTRNDSPRSKISEVSSKIFNEHDTFGMLNNFINNMDDESKDKISLLTFLSIPRIMNMIISKDQKFTFVFYCSPTNISCLYGIETYIFKWNECKNFNLTGYFDLINVENCYLNNDNRNIFEIILNNNGKNNNSDEFNGTNHYYIEAEGQETAINYVNAINFTSQLVKYRVYLRKKMKNSNNH